MKKLFLDRDPPMVRVHYDGSKKSIFDDISPDCIKHFIKEEEDMTVPDTPPSDGKLGGDPQCNVDLKGMLLVILCPRSSACSISLFSFHFRS